MIQNSQECLLSTEFCGGVLMVLRKHYSQLFYGPAKESEKPRLDVVLQKNDVIETIQTIEKLFEFAGDKNCDVFSCVSKDYPNFAYIFSLLLKAGRLITSSELHEFLETDFDLIISRNLPRIEDKVLCFSVVKTLSIGVFEVLIIRISLDKFGVELATVPRRRN